MTTKTGLQAAISGALDTVLARPQTERERLRRALAADSQRRHVQVVLSEHRDRLAAARALGRRQGRELVRREHAQALTAALDTRIEAALERRRRFVPPGPVRLF